MADDKKPKIDLKARLGKTGLNVTPPPGQAALPTPGPTMPPMPPMHPAMPGQPMPGQPPMGHSQIPAPPPGYGPPPGSRPPPMMSPGVPIPPAVAPPPGFGPPPGMDPNHPLAAAVQPYRAPSAPSRAPQAQRIEIDESAIDAARGGARKQGIVIGLVVAFVLGAVGYVAGGAQERSAGRTKSVADAKDLSTDVGKSKEQLKALADKMEAGRNTLVKDKKFPDSLARDINGINIDFDGTKLAGRRFSGFSTETTSGLVEFISQVQALNDRKQAVAGLLTKLQKPITEQFASAGKTQIQHVVLLGRQDDAHNQMAILAPLKEPIQVTPPNITLPGEFNFTDPLSRQNAKLAKYEKGDLTKPAAVYVFPKSYDAVCPSETSGQTAQLASQIARLIADLKGEGGGDQSMVQEPKPGLIERADKLITALNKIN